MTLDRDRYRRGERPRYGFDAPGVIVGMFGTALALGLAALTLLWFGRSHVWARILTGLALVAGLIPLCLGGVMVAYSSFGKLRIRDFMLDLAPWRGDEQVLDIGAGAGLLLIGAAKRLTTGCAVGIDIWSAKDLSGDARATIVRNLALEGVGERCEVRTQDARRLDMPSASFDRVVSLLCLHNIEPVADREQACREIARVLKPGGSAAIGDYVPTDDYARVFQAEGLVVRQQRAFLRALGPMWIVVADKPA